MFRSSLSLLLSLGLSAQDPAPTKPAATAPVPPVSVPTFANQTCPIMGKKVSMPLFVDTELGRFYLCCKPCNKKVLANVAAAHRTAYPTVQEWQNTKCPVSGEAIGADAVAVTLQGHRFSVCCDGCVETARTHSQVTLAKITQEKLIDVGNTTCPISGKPTVANAFVRIGDHLVHLAVPALVEDVAKAPDETLRKAIEIAKAQPPKPPHVHRRAKPDDATPPPANGKD